MDQTFPKIGIVIIGINEETHIADCIKAIKAANYPQHLLEIAYIDGGSYDRSPEIAGEYEGVKVIRLNNPHPTPGRGRNAGWKALSAPIIQFLDADMILDPDWFRNAYDKLDKNVAAICGNLKEIHPDKNVFHTLADMEWYGEEGICNFFGGGVLIKREALEETGGYDEKLIAGEDPELSYRVRVKGWIIQRINNSMAKHDINMSSIIKYLKRSFRSGYAYGEICLTHITCEEKIWLREFIRIIVRSTVPLLFILIGLLTGYMLTGILFGLLVIFMPVLRISRFKAIIKGPRKQNILYTLDNILIVYPQFLGILRYIWGRTIGKPLRNTLRNKV